MRKWMVPVRDLTYNQYIIGVISLIIWGPVKVLSWWLVSWTLIPTSHTCSCLFDVLRGGTWDPELPVRPWRFSTPITPRVTVTVKEDANSCLCGN